MTIKRMLAIFILYSSLLCTPITTISAIKLSSQAPLFLIQAPSKVSAIGNQSSLTLNNLLFINSGESTADDEILLYTSFSSFFYKEEGDPLSSTSSYTFTLTHEPQFIWGPYIYPNPMSLSTGGSLGFLIDKAADFTLYIYNMLGHKILEKPISAQEDLPHYIQIDQGLFYNYSISGGVYFFVLAYDNGTTQIYKKGKFVIMP